MPFKYKLSRRLAISRTTMLAVSIMAACEIIEIAEPTSQEEDVIAVFIQPDSITLHPNQTQRFRVYLNGTTDGDTVQVAVVYVATGGSIAQDGLYTAGQTPGIYRVIAAAADGVLADTASVTVVPVPVASVAVSPARAIIPEGMTIQLLVEPRDSVENPLTGRAVSWSSSNPEVAMVSASGLVTALTAGITTISAASEGASGTAAITVTAARPGAVSDLSVVSVSQSSVTLQFTEVDDGTGQPARYDVRFEPAPISWGSAAEVSQGTCAPPVEGTSIGATRTCTVEGLSAGTTYEFQLVPYRGELDVNAVFGPVSNVAQGTRAPAGPDRANEPANMTTVSDRPWSQACEDGWNNCAPLLTDTRCGTPPCWEVVTDPTAPHSPPDVGQWNFREGCCAGFGPTAQTSRMFTAGEKPVEKIYVQVHFKVSSNWFGHPLGRLKFINIHPDQGAANLIMDLNGAGSGRLQTAIAIQGSQVPGADDSNRRNNLANSEIIRGRWHEWELIAEINTPGVADGKIDWWLDGVKQGSYSDLGWQEVTRGETWAKVAYNMIYGGTGHTPPADQFVQIDHMYISIGNK